MVRLQRAGTPLDIEEQLTHPRSPLRSVFLNGVLHPRSGPSTFILDQKEDSNRRLLGLAQVRVRPGRPERDVVFMSPKLDNGTGSHAIWQRMLTHICVQAAQQGSFRLYARLPMESEEVYIFKNVGFLEYIQEHVFQLNKTANRHVRSTLKLRPQQAGDGWGLQKLYATLAPRSVQTAEGLAQGQWDLTRSHWGEQGRRSGYVWEDKGEILGALHLRSGKCGYWIRTLLHPNTIDKTEDLCRAALNLTAAKPDLPVYFAFRQYEAGWQNTLPALNFTPLTTQQLMVKPMTVRVRELTPARLPTLESSPTEGASMITHHAESAQPTAQNGHAKSRAPKILSLLL